MRERRGSARGFTHIELLVVKLFCTALLTITSSESRGADDTRRPNIIMIVADDFGYGDLGVHGCRDLSTPHIDSLAAAGVRCTNGYVSAPVCSPTRAGLLTGRYQQRFGHEFNEATPHSELDLKQVTIADRLQKAGYATGMVGKWHLGNDDSHRPQKRGFDEFFGFLAGSNSYLPNRKTGIVPNILRGTEDANEKEYLTTGFGREAANFINQHKQQPFFLYLPFNATHNPREATDKNLERYASITNEKRRTFAAMTASMDDAVGRVLEALRENKLEENTLIAFISDNGGPSQINGSSNTPFRGVKGETREGGIHTPFILQWKGKLPKGVTYDPMVISLDLHPTFLQAAGIAIPPDAKLDGVNLLPHLTGETKAVPHDTLYWRYNAPPLKSDRYKWAIRRGNWKLFTDINSNHNKDKQPVRDGNLMLVDLSQDATESHDLSAKHPEKRQELLAAWQKWNAELPTSPTKKYTADADSQ